MIITIFGPVSVMRQIRLEAPNHSSLYSFCPSKALVSSDYCCKVRKWSNCSGVLPTSCRSKVGNSRRRSYSTGCSKSRQEDSASSESPDGSCTGGSTDGMEGVSFLWLSREEANRRSSLLLQSSQVVELQWGFTHVLQIKGWKLEETFIQHRLLQEQAGGFSIK